MGQFSVGFKLSWYSTAPLLQVMDSNINFYYYALGGDDGRQAALLKFEKAKTELRRNKRIVVNTLEIA